jgi:hypothetical protein
MWFRPSFSGLGASEVIKRSEEFYISTAMVEHTLKNLKRAWGINEQIAYATATNAHDRLYFGGSTTVPIHRLKFVAKQSTMVAVFYRVVAVDFGEIAYAKNSDTLMPVTFRALLDTSQSVGQQIGYITEGPAYGYSNLVCRVTKT